MCDVTKRRFNCTCPTGFSGFKCQIVPPLKSCRDVLLFEKTKSNGIYNIVDQNNISFPVYCDFGSETGMAWTLIQSHSFQNNGAFTDKPFYLYNLPINQNTPEWSSYRLSMSRMKSIGNISTHWRATCNFHTDGMDYRDYWKVSIESLDLFVKPPTHDFCVFSEYVNVRGNECTNCTVFTAYSDTYTLHMDSWFGYSRGCEFDGQPGGVYNEDNFGHYGATNPAFRCTSSANSTTQFWLGSS